jgi:hypothetical protein
LGGACIGGRVDFLATAQRLTRHPYELKDGCKGNFKFEISDLKNGKGKGKNNRRWRFLTSIY